MIALEWLFVLLNINIALFVAQPSVVFPISIKHVHIMFQWILFDRMDRFQLKWTFFYISTAAVNEWFENLIIFNQ